MTIQEQITQLKNALEYETIYAYPSDIEIIRYLRKRIKELQRSINNVD